MTSLQLIEVCSTALRSAVCRSDHSISVRLRSGLWVIPPLWVFSFQLFCCRYLGVLGILLLLNHPDGLTSDSRTLWYTEQFIVYWMNARCPNRHPSTTVLTVSMSHSCWYAKSGFVHCGQTSPLYSHQSKNIVPESFANISPPAIFIYPGPLPNHSHLFSLFLILHS